MLAMLHARIWPKAPETTSRDEVGQGEDQRVSLNCQAIPVFAVDRQKHSAYPTDASHRDWPWLGFKLK